jgi:hypothetical protein
MEKKLKPEALKYIYFLKIYISVHIRELLLKNMIKK